MVVRTACAALALAVSCHPVWAGPGCSKPIKITTGEWAPYNYIDEQGRYTGMDVELSRAIMEEAGCELIELDRMPPARNSLLFASGQVDMMTGASRTGERSRVAFFSAPYRHEAVRLFVPATIAPRYADLHSFTDVVRAGVTILAPRVGWYGEQYHAHYAELKAAKRLSQFNEFPDGMNMLAAGRASLIMGDQASVLHAAARRGMKLLALPFGLHDAPVHLMLNKQTVTEHDVRLIDAAIERLRRRGVIDRIRRAYGML